MKIPPNYARPLTFAATGLGSLLLLGAVGCNGCASSSGAATAPIVSSSTTDTSTDNAAADGNLAPVSGQPTTAVLGQSSSYTPQQSSETYPGQAPAPIVRGSADQSAPSYNTADPTYNNTDSNEAAGEDALAASDIQAEQPPPPLPEYDQPPAPESDYLWTPGYWAYANSGYYWTPGVWCPPPYYGALWTPPYWGFYGGHYRFHRGYWGPHVGFYGGVDYGFGYIGIGFFGGYWQGHNFYYNRSVTNVGGGIHNVYNREVVYNNVHYSGRPVDRVSYNGGRGGLNVAPRPQELAAMHETHVGALHEQVQVRTQAAGNREQFFAQNHGRPAQAALARPAAVSHQIGNAPRPVQQEMQRSAQIQQHNAQTQPQRGAESQPQRGAESQPQRGPEPTHVGPVNSRPEAQRAPEPQQQQRTPQLQQRGPEQQPQRNMQAQPQQQHVTPTEQRPPTEARPAPVERQQLQQLQARPQPQQARPEPQQPRPQPQQARPEPQQRPQPEARPQPQPQRAAPPPHPAPAARPPEQHQAPHEGRPPR
jgi:hypothetical protein